MSALVVVVALGLSASASAQVTLGQVAPLGAETVLCNSPGYDEVQLSVSSGAGNTVPVAGVLTSWSSRSDAGGQLALKVYRPVAGAYLVVAIDGPRTLTPGALSTFPVSIPVLAGDLIGTGVPPSAGSNCYYRTEFPTDLIAYQGGTVPVGGTAALAETEAKSRLNISATLLPPPVISSITPAKGSVLGGTEVVIAGANFASVQAVSFGSLPAKRFTVDSEGQITAFAPKSSKLVRVAVSVTTTAGLAGAPTTFLYEGCRVPKLKDKKLKAVKKQAKKADCKVGKVKTLGDATAKTGEVVKQSPPPGKILAPGAKIKVTLGD